jgi:hypothetical protein
VEGVLHLVDMAMHSVGGNGKQLCGMMHEVRHAHDDSGMQDEQQVMSSMLEELLQEPCPLTSFVL